MDNEERLIVRLSSDDLLFLSELVFRGKFSSESDAVCEAVRNLIDSYMSSDEKIAVLQKASARRSYDLSDFAAEGKDAQKVLGNVIKRGLESDRGED